MKAHLDSPKAIKRAVGYIRESTQEQGKGYSPSAQKDGIENYAKKNNIDIIDWYQDFSSGCDTKKRVDFNRMIERAEKKEFDLVLVYHTSRFARNVEDARVFKKLLREKLNIDVISVNQEFGDWSNPSSFLHEGVNELFDAHYSKQLQYWILGAIKEKRRQGRQPGNPPIGYKKDIIGNDLETGRIMYDNTWKIDKEKAKIVKQIFELYATRSYSMSNIADKLNSEGLRTQKGNLFSYSSIKTILSNRVYLGLVYSPRKGYPELPGEHPSLISEELFGAVSQVMQERQNKCGRPTAQHRFYLLQGLVYCYHCKDNLKTDAPEPKMYCETQTRKNRKDRQTYCCKMKREYNACKQKKVLVEKIDKQVIDFMKGMKIPESLHEDILEGINNRIDNDNSNIDKENKIKSLKAKLKKYEFMYVEANTITSEEYIKYTKPIKEELDTYKVVVSGAKMRKYKKKLAKELIKKFQKQYKNILENPEELREWILLLIKRVWVKNDKVVVIEIHDDYKDFFEENKKVIVQFPLATPKRVL